MTREMHISGVIYLFVTCISLSLTGYYIRKVLPPKEEVLKGRTQGKVILLRLVLAVLLHNLLEL